LREDAAEGKMNSLTLCDASEMESGKARLLRGDSMPEGDTIYRAARALQKAIGGKVVTGFETGLAKLARVNDDAPLVGRVVERVESRGKWLLMFFSGDLILVTHMLMSGSWHLYRTGERWRMGRARMRVVIRTADWEAVAFNVPITEFHTARSLARSSQVPMLGLDILAEEFTVEGGVARLDAYAKENSETEIAVVLLNQRVLAGLGNVYKSEVAFAAGVNPFRAMRTITRQEMEKMVEVAQRYMKANVADGVSTVKRGERIVTYSGNRRTTHAMDREERLWVYGRQGQECRRCGATVMMRKQGVQARSTYWCPECQPWVGIGEAPVGRVSLVRRGKIGS
jgi:endonuclease VIII